MSLKDLGNDKNFKKSKIPPIKYMSSNASFFVCLYVCNVYYEMYYSEVMCRLSDVISQVWLSYLELTVILYIQVGDKNFFLMSW